MNLQQLLHNNILFDSHSHFSDLTEDPESAIKRAKDNNIEYVIDIAVDLKNAIKVLENSKRFSPNIIPTAGIHPEILIPGSDLYDPKMNILSLKRELKQLESFVVDNDISMIGE